MRPASTMRMMTFDVLSQYLLISTKLFPQSSARSRERCNSHRDRGRHEVRWDPDGEYRDVDHSAWVQSAVLPVDTV